MKNLDGWIPIGFEWADSQVAAVDWCFMGGMRFTDPFFENTMQRAMRLPFRVLFRQKTSVEALEERAVTHPGIAPTGFIFHMSRCGSTLISQMLAATDQNIVISEGWPIESAISADAQRPGVTWEQRLRLLQGVVRALGQSRAGKETRYFIKFDAPQTLDLPLVREAFPDVPWIFLYRNPVEVIVSHFRRRASWIIPGGGRKVRGMRLNADSFARPDDYAADVLASICEAALRGMTEPGGMLIDYSELPEAVYEKLAAHFRCTWSEAELQLMRQAAARDAKQPERAFSADSDSKRQEADARVREICARKLDGLYKRLSELG